MAKNQEAKILCESVVPKDAKKLVSFMERIEEARAEEIEAEKLPEVKRNTRWNYTPQKLLLDRKLSAKRSSFVKKATPCDH